ncbi:carboxypeptidase-like regulatory domain-containing protein [Bacteroides intestinalis]|uniref:carboxypeptidase-like regulatory domain-containing protein n=1 Tax=Bacteroides intestinalis TaxID=329854 RepID=UPI0022E7F939|nr:carboxypeptidase-like regulatory domain-containing protein [Bacteroides intestinalis]
MKRKLMLLLACLFVGIGLVTAQTQTITGVVISEEDGQPVIGASVLVKGTQLGTITGVDGDFTLSNVPSSANKFCENATNLVYWYASAGSGN